MRLAHVAVEFALEPLHAFQPDVAGERRTETLIVFGGMLARRHVPGASCLRGARALIVAVVSLRLSPACSLTVSSSRA